MEAPTQSALLLRLCECRPGEVVDGATGGGRGGGTAAAGGTPLGTAVSAAWDPTHAHRVGVLYSSGTLRLWDVVADVHRDFALYIPASGLPLGGGDVVRVADRRLVAPIAQFEFLPFRPPTHSRGSGGSGGGLPRIAFTLRRSASLYIADLPPGAPTSPAAQSALPTAAVYDDHYMRGSRVYECAAALPAAATAMTSWLVSAAPTPMAALAVGCDDGSLAVWLLSTAFNPETVVGMRSLRDASPGMIRALQLTPTAAGSALTPAAAAAGAGADAGEPPSVRTAAHGGRVRALRALALAGEGDWAGGGGDDAAARGGVRTGAYAAARAGAAAPANTLLASAGDDGRLLLWRVDVSPPVAPFAPGPSTLLLHPDAGWERSAAASRAAPFAVSLTRLLAMPTDGTPVTALASTSWPLASEDSVGRFLSAAAAFSSPQAQAAAAPWRVGAAYHCRALLAAGAGDGSVTVWEVLVPRGTASIMDLREAGGAAVGVASGADRYRGRAAVAAPLPAVRLIGLVTAGSVDPVAAVSLAPPAAAPAGSSGNPYELAVGGVDGAVSVYSLDGVTAGGSGGEGSGDGGGSAGPVICRLRGIAGNRTGTDPASLAVVAAMSHEAAMLAHLPVAQQARGADAPPALGAGVTSRYTTALTAAALAGLQRALVACSFNAAAPGVDVDADISAALLAVNGAGELSLWPRDALPGSAPVGDDGSEWDDSSAGGGDIAAAGGMPEDACGLRPAHVPSMASVLAGEPVPYAQRPAPAFDDDSSGVVTPRTGSVAQFADAPDAAPRAVAAHQPSGGSPGVKPPLQPAPMAAAVCGPVYDDDDDDGIDGGGGDGGAGGPPQSRVLADTAASKMRRSAVAAEAASGGSGSGRRARSSDAAAKDYLRHAAADAVRSAYEPAVEGHHTSTLTGKPLYHAQHIPAALAAVAVPAPERWLMRLQASVARDLEVDPAALDLLNASAGSRAGSAPRRRAAATSTSPPPPSSRSGGAPAMDATSASAARGAAAMLHSDDGDNNGGGGADTPNPRPLSAGCKNPARVAAALLRDAAETVRASTILARSVDGHLTAVDVHPDAVGVYNRIAARGPEAHHHMVAPTVGSSAAILARIAALEAATFDVPAAVRAALAARGCTDRVVAAGVAARLAAGASGPAGSRRPRGGWRTPGWAGALASGASGAPSSSMTPGRQRIWSKHPATPTRPAPKTCWKTTD